MTNLLVRRPITPCLTAAAAIALAWACGYGGQVVFQGVTPVEDPFSVASRELISMNYSIVAGDRDAGFLRAEKHEGRHMLAKQIQVLTVNFSGSSFSITATTDYLPLEGSRKPDNPSSIVQRDGRRLKRVMEQAGS